MWNMPLSVGRENINLFPEALFMPADPASNLLFVCHVLDMFGMHCFLTLVFTECFERPVLTESVYVLGPRSSLMRHPNHNWHPAQCANARKVSWDSGENARWYSSVNSVISGAEMPENTDARWSKWVDYGCGLRWIGIWNRNATDTTHLNIKQQTQFATMSTSNAKINSKELVMRHANGAQCLHVPPFSRSLRAKTRVPRKLGASGTRLGMCWI